ncbi:prolyl oligopeptidase family serine peptidase [Phenylobacterium immobile]|uniref:prolyl oligopeptidase family serine peptidase n=1 Tax=Phenylobacterium immobile TaxID=21 RepID=UPI000B86170A
MLLAGGSGLAQSIAPAPADPYVWMEEIEGARALDWAKGENARSLPKLQSDPRYAGLYADALAIATAKDRIPAVSFAGKSALRDFWQDAEHVRGIWRTASLESYRAGAPDWRTILDMDALAKTEDANWVWEGAMCLAPEERYCLVSLSNGGKDAVIVREFDTETRQFVDGGFNLPEGKHRFDWIDRDTLIVVTDWTPGDVTTSSYPFIAKIVKRGQRREAAVEVFRGTKTDGGYGVSPIVLRDAEGQAQAVIIQRPLDTYNAEYHLLLGDKTVRLALPLKSTIQGYVAGRVLATLEDDWSEKGLKAGDLVDFDIAALKAAPSALAPTVVLRPTESQSVEQVATTRDRLVVALLDNVKGQILSFAREGAGWKSARLALPTDSTIVIAAAADADDSLILNISSYLQPNSQWLADASGGATATLRQLPARFDAGPYVTEQMWATSKDGTPVPYSVIRRKDIKYDGTNPTVLYAYGGFLVSMTPAYSGTIGKLWLDKGGVYVVANIRGGGEFGPRWHNAGLKLDRMRVYDDFFAVSRDLIAKKITSPAKLGIMGGSNGGLLMGVALTKHPELYKAVVIQVPLFDMIAYDHIGAGSSWIGEYGDPKVPAERAMLMTYSPYQNLKPGQPYPQVFIETSTKDDRVHPAHARKAAARLKEYGYDFLYYENIDGGHAAAANLNERAMRQALEFTYLAQRLMD